MQGSVGVVIPPQGYLQRLREICSKHGILLIFDEVITGFGRMGAWFGAQAFGVTPDLITFAKAVVNGTAHGRRDERWGIYDAYCTGPDYAVELFHGYTYSAHPLAVAAAHATLDIQDSEQTRHLRYAEVGLAGGQRYLALANLIDVHNFGATAAFELTPLPGTPACGRSACSRKRSSAICWCVSPGIPLRWRRR